jgi:hypothetical protein
VFLSNEITDGLVFGPKLSASKRVCRDRTFKEEFTMARGVYSHELADQDFQWLMSSYTERVATVATVDLPTLPVVLIIFSEEERNAFLASTLPALTPLAAAEGGNSQRGLDEPTSE